MADELHSFLDILADVAKQQEDNESNQNTTQAGEERTDTEPNADTFSAPQNQTAKESEPSEPEIIITEDDDPDFFKSTVSNVRKNSKNKAKNSVTGEISIFDQTKKQTRTGRTAAKTASSKTTSRRKSASSGTSTRRRSSSSRPAGFRIPRSSSIIKMIIKALIDMIFGKKSRSSARKSNLTGTDVLNRLLGENTSSSESGVNSSSKTSISVKGSDKLLTSVVKELFGNGKSANTQYLPVFRKIVRSILETDRASSLKDTSGFTKEAANLGFSAKESAEASKILEGLLNSGLSNESISAVLEQFSDTDE